MERNLVITVVYKLSNYGNVINGKEEFITFLKDHQPQIEINAARNTKLTEVNHPCK